jgi:hypothetical protein
MNLIFRRTGNRRYSVEAQRPGFPNLEMNPAPGYDPLIPHDLMHLVVEAQLGLTHAIYGQLAAGGTAGTFRLIVKSDESSRKISRARHRVNARGKKMLSKAREECLQSERATYICWQAWLDRSASPERRKTAQTMADQAKQVRGVADATELQALNQRKLDEICKHLDQLGSHWSSLEIGQSMTVHWPDLAIVTEPAADD